MDRIHTYAFGCLYDDFDWSAERDKVYAAEANGASVGDLWAMPKKDHPRRRTLGQSRTVGAGSSTKLNQGN